MLLPRARPDLNLMRCGLRQVQVYLPADLQLHGQMHAVMPSRWAAR